MNLNAKARMEAMGAPLTYKKGSGGHNWDFWDLHIRNILDWMLKK